jgi:hypothetical protein
MHTLPADEAKVETVFIRQRHVFASSALLAFLACARSGLAMADAA